MRTEHDAQTIHHTAESRWVPGQPEWRIDINLARSVGVRTFTRSNITINKRDAFGFRPPSPYKGSYSEYIVPTCTHEWKGGTDPRDWQYRVTQVAMGFKQVFGNHTYFSFNNWENALKQQCLRSIKDQKVNLAMTIAFLPQTLRMLRGKFSLAGDVLTAAQRRDWRRVGRLLDVNPKSTADFYLEVLFGWLQLMRDITGVVEELHRKCNKPDVRFFYGRARRIQSAGPVWHYAEPYHNTRHASYNYQGDRKIEHSAVMIYRGEASVLTRMAQLGLANPAELLWDHVRWSWVINLGISIGDFIATLDATVGLSYLGGTYTQYGRIAGPVVLEPHKGTRVHTVKFDTSPGYYEEMSFNRRTIDDKIDPFVLKNPFDAPIALTGAVIAAVVQKGRKATPQPPKGPTRYVYQPRRTRNLPPVTYRP